MGSLIVTCLIAPIAIGSDAGGDLFVGVFESETRENLRRTDSFHTRRTG
jgi:hypothetical protein